MPTKLSAYSLNPDGLRRVCCCRRVLSKHQFFKICLQSGLWPDILEAFLIRKAQKVRIGDLYISTKRGRGAELEDALKNVTRIRLLRFGPVFRLI